MIKLIMFAVIGIVAGVGGGSVLTVTKARKAHAASVAEAAKIVADSLAKAEESGQHVTAEAPSDSAKGSDTTHAAVAEEHSDASERAPGRAARTVASRPTVVAKRPASHNRGVQTVEANGVPRESPSVSSAATLPTKTLATPTQPAGVEKLTRIFAAMPAKDAARVLEQLDDSEVQSVISALNEKKAAAILQNFPPPRAAIISKAVIRSALDRR